MAERRMFCKAIIESDNFLDMPHSAQCLYVHLAMNADDDGFVNNPRKIQRMLGCADDDLKLLLMKQFIIGFESGVVVVKHWKMHNYVRVDRYKPTIYTAEKALIEMSPNNEYRYTNGIPTVYQTDTNGIPRLGKDRLGKDRLGKDRESKQRKAPPARAKYGRYENVLLSDEELETLKKEFPYEYEQRIERLSEYMASKGATYKNHLATIRAWARKDRDKLPPRGMERPLAEQHNEECIADFDVMYAQQQMEARNEGQRY